MAKKETIQQALYYNTIQDLAQELIQQSGDPEIQQLSESLLTILQKARGPVTRQRAVSEAIESISSVQSADRLFRSTLDQNRAAIRETTSYQPLPGKQQVIRPGPLMVCPVEGCPYEQFLMQKGEETTCPTHHLALVPRPKPRRGKQS